jgi:hypothetical protein
MLNAKCGEPAQTAAGCEGRRRRDARPRVTDEELIEQIAFIAPVNGSRRFTQIRKHIAIDRG